MHPAVARRTLLALGGLVLAGPAGLAAPVTIEVPLSGAQQVPPVPSSGTGMARLTYDPSTRVVTWSITYGGMSSPVIMAHFHGPAPAGRNASVLIWLTQRNAPVHSPITGQTTLTPAQAEQFAAGLWYVNVHTQDNPAGEIRGQVVWAKG
jgi:hypothetical protein